MNSYQNYCIDKLLFELEKRKEKNSSYSLRAFARDLKIDPANLSAILRGKRKIPLSKVDVFIEQLGLDEKDKELFLHHLQRSNLKIDNIQVSERHRKILDEQAFFNIISRWEHFAILKLLEIKKIDTNSHHYISKRLCIDIEMVNLCIEELQDTKLLRVENLYYVPTEDKLETSENIVSEALKESHRNTLSIASNKLETIPVKSRDYSSLTLGLNPLKLDAARSIIREFHDKLEALVSKDAKEVYLFSSQFFPVSRPEDEVC